MDTANVYDDARRAETYAKLDFPGTYFLAYRDLPEIIAAYVKGNRAVDFGCGTGRSTRFLKRLGFDAIGIDIAADMISKAREQDPQGDYRQVDAEGLARMDAGISDLVLCAFTFDNVPTTEQKVTLFTRIGRLLSSNGRIVNLVSSPDIYVHEWASFSTRDFPENRSAKSGDPVQIIITDSDDSRPVVDVVCSDEDYRRIFDRAGLAVVETRRPLARESEPFRWVNETRIAPWVIYVLKRASAR